MTYKAPQVEEFTIIQGTAAHVELYVNRNLDKGWTLNGPLTTVQSDGKNILTQGMIKYAKTS
jgi:hypothetical protein